MCEGCKASNIRLALLGQWHLCFVLLFDRYPFMRDCELMSPLHDHILYCSRMCLFDLLLVFYFLSLFEYCRVSSLSICRCRSPGEQLVLCSQHQYRTRRLWMVCCSWESLGHHTTAVWTVSMFYSCFVVVRHFSKRRKFVTDNQTDIGDSDQWPSDCFNESITGTVWNKDHRTLLWCIKLDLG